MWSFVPQHPDAKKRSAQEDCDIDDAYDHRVFKRQTSATAHAHYAFAAPPSPHVGVKAATQSPYASPRVTAPEMVTPEFRPSAFMQTEDESNAGAGGAEASSAAKWHRLLAYNASSAMSDAQVTTGTVCGTCASPGASPIPCMHCEKECCDVCVKECARCQDCFCGTCSVNNYDAPQDRTFCLSCDSLYRQQMTTFGAGGEPRGSSTCHYHLE